MLFASSSDNSGVTIRDFGGKTTRVDYKTFDYVVDGESVSSLSLSRKGIIAYVTSEKYRQLNYVFEPETVSYNTIRVDLKNIDKTPLQVNEWAMEIEISATAV